MSLVLLSSGIAADEEKKLRNVLSVNKPDIQIVQHYGGGSGLLHTEITEALKV